MPIPKIIVQTHRNLEINKALRKTWIDNNPGFKYFFYDDDACRKVVSKYYPRYLDSYDKLPLKAQKADLFRYMAINLHGGIYADVDTICKSPLHDYIDLEAENMVIGTEMQLSLYKSSVNDYLNEYAAPEQYSQYVFAASPRHPVLQALIATIDASIKKLTHEQLKNLSKNNRFVLDLTGPFAFTRTINFHLTLLPNLKIQILPQKFWGYVKWHNTDIDPHKNQDVKVIHLCQGTWRTPAMDGMNLTNQATEVKNPGQ